MATQEIAPIEVRVSEMEEQRFVDPNEFYSFTLQLGQTIRWRKYGGGRWKRDPENDQDGLKAMRHHPAVHRIQCLSGEALNGLIAASERWRRANKERDLKVGSVSRMIYVSDIKKTKPPAIVGNRLDAEQLSLMLERSLVTIAEKSAEAQAVQSELLMEAITKLVETKTKN